MTETKTQWSRLPWGAAIALLAVLLLNFAFERIDSFKWAKLSLEVPGSWFVERGFMRERWTLERMSAWAGERPKPASDSDFGLNAVVLGSSQVLRGIDLDLLGESFDDDLRFHLISYAGFGPFEARSIAEPLHRHHADLVILMVSEFDTHRTRTLAQVPLTARLPALWDLGQAAGWRWSYANRRLMLRMLSSSLLDLVRYRRVLRELYLGAFDFELEPAVVVGGDPPLVLGRETDHKDVDLMAAVRDLEKRRPDLSLKLVRIKQVNSIAQGHHASVQMELIEKAVKVMTRGGIDVVLVEGPLLPWSRDLYEREARREFRRWVAKLAEGPGVTFVSEQELGRTRARDFADLTHLSEDGSLDFTKRLIPHLGVSVQRIQEDRSRSRDRSDR